MKIITFLLAIVFSITIQAQWTTDTAVNTLVVDTPSGDLKAIGTSDGQTYIVFWKAVAAPEYYELRLQLLDASGNRQFGDEGIIIGNDLPMGSWTALMTLNIDDQDNLYVGVTGTDDFSSHAYKIDTSGTQLWGNNGATLNSGAMVTILPLQSGDAIVAWSNNGVLNMQKFDTTGNAVWTSIKTVNLSSGNTSPGNLFELSNGDFIMLIHNYFYGISSTIYAQRYNTDGIAQWASAVQLSDAALVYNTEYSGTQDGDIVYLGYKSSQSNRFDSYLQRIDPDGTLPWGINGADFDINQTDYEMETSIAFTPGSQYIWSICTYSNPSQDQYGEFIQKFDKDTGARQLTENGKELYAISTDDNKHSSFLYTIDDKPFFLLSKGFDDGISPTTLEVVLLDNNGDFLWAEQSKPIATYAANKKRTHFLKPVDGQVVTVFIEEKTSDLMIYAQNFTDVDLLSVNEGITYSNFNINVYPNPTNRFLSFEFEHLNADNIQIAIYNSLGKQVLLSKGQSIENKLITLDLDKLAEGNYYYKIIDENLVYRGKISIVGY